MLPVVRQSWQGTFLSVDLKCALLMFASGAFTTTFDMVVVNCVQVLFVARTCRCRYTERY